MGSTENEWIWQKFKTICSNISTNPFQSLQASHALGLVEILVKNKAIYQNFGRLQELDGLLEMLRPFVDSPSPQATETLTDACVEQQHELSPQLAASVDCAMSVRGEIADGSLESLPRLGLFTQCSSETDEDIGADFIESQTISGAHQPIAMHEQLSLPEVDILPELPTERVASEVNHVNQSMKKIRKDDKVLTNALPEPDLQPAISPAILPEVVKPAQNFDDTMSVSSAYSSASEAVAQDTAAHAMQLEISTSMPYEIEAPEEKVSKPEETEKSEEAQRSDTELGKEKEETTFAVASPVSDRSFIYPMTQVVKPKSAATIPRPRTEPRPTAIRKSIDQKNKRRSFASLDEIANNLAKSANAQELEHSSGHESEVTVSESSSESSDSGSDKNIRLAPKRKRKSMLLSLAKSVPKVQVVEAKFVLKKRKPEFVPAPQKKKRKFGKVLESVRALEVVAARTVLKGSDTDE